MKLDFRIFKKHKLIILLVSLILIVVLFSIFIYRQTNLNKENASANSTGLFSENFETGLDPIWDTPCPTRSETQQLSCEIVNAPARSGNKSMKFNLLHNDEDVQGSRRTELEHESELPQQNRWYKFSVFLPTDYVPDPSFEIVTQWHSRPDFNLGEIWRSPPLTLATVNGQWRVTNRWDSKALTNGNTPEGSTQKLLGNYATGVWTDWVFRVKWAWDSTGILEVWQNNQLVYTKTGPNMYNDQNGVYVKMGIYKPDWKFNLNASVTRERTLYIDDITFSDLPLISSSSSITTSTSTQSISSLASVSSTNSQISSLQSTPASASQSSQISSTTSTSSNFSSLSANSVQSSSVISSVSNSSFNSNEEIFIFADYLDISPDPVLEGISVYGEKDYTVMISKPELLTGDTQCTFRIKDRTASDNHPTRGYDYLTENILTPIGTGGFNTQNKTLTLTPNNNQIGIKILSQNQKYTFYNLQIRCTKSGSDLPFATDYQIIFYFGALSVVQIGGTAN